MGNLFMQYKNEQEEEGERKAARGRRRRSTARRNAPLPAAGGRGARVSMSGPHAAGNGRRGSSVEGRCQGCHYPWKGREEEEVVDDEEKIDNICMEENLDHRASRHRPYGRAHIRTPGA